jgi:hypothetical protein
MDQKPLVEQSKEFISTRNTYYEMSKEIAKFKIILDQKNKELNLCEHKLHSLCNHKWIMDDPQYQTPTSWTCSDCGYYK